MKTTIRPSPSPVRLGLRPNVAQFGLLVAVNALLGGTIGQERTVLPLLAEREFGLTAYTASLTFIVAFGLTKAITNLFAGRCPTGMAASPCSSPGGSWASRCRSCSSGRRRGDGWWPQRAPRGEPGADLVDDGHHEDRPRRAGAPGSRHGPQRVCRLWSGRGHRSSHRLDRHLSWPAPGTVSPRGRRHRHRAQSCSSARPGATPTTRPPKSGSRLSTFPSAGSSPTPPCETGISWP
jgi:hypothetical protein